MTWYDALLLGVIQGLTEFLPVSSSGHIELGKALLGVELKENLTFTVVVHGATVLSTIVVYRNTIRDLLSGLFRFQWNAETRYIFLLFLSMLPVLVVGLFYKDQVETLFFGNITLVGLMLWVTALLLTFTYFKKNQTREVGPITALVIGIAQSVAVIPGISRSGATISTGLMLGIKKEAATRFSFLMVLVPILGANLLDVLSKEGTNNGLPIHILVIGFLAAFFSGWLACRWMIVLVKKQKLIYFAIYCFVVGLLAIIFS